MTKYVFTGLKYMNVSNWYFKTVSGFYQTSFPPTVNLYSIIPYS